MTRGNSSSDTEAKFASDFFGFGKTVFATCRFSIAQIFFFFTRLVWKSKTILPYVSLLFATAVVVVDAVAIFFPFATLTQFCFRVSFASAALVAAFLSRVVLPFIFSKAPSMGICANTNTHGQIAAYSPRGIIQQKRLLLFLVTAKSNTFISYYLVCSRH